MAKEQNIDFNCKYYLPCGKCDKTNELCTYYIPYSVYTYISDWINADYNRQKMLQIDPDNWMYKSTTTKITEEAK